MSLELSINELTAVVGRLTDGVENLTLRIVGVAGIPAAVGDSESVEPEPVKPEPALAKPEPEPAKPARKKSAPVEEALDPQPMFDRLDEVRRVSIEMLRIDGKALKEIYKRVGGSDKLSELPLHTYGAVIAAIAAWRKEAGK